MSFIEKESSETLAEHLLRNADHLGMGEDLRSRLIVAFRLEQGPHANRVSRSEALVEADQIAKAVRVELGLGDGAAAAVAQAAAAQLAGLQAERQQLEAGLAKAQRRGDDEEVSLFTAALRGMDRRMALAVTKARGQAQPVLSPRFVQAQATQANGAGARRIKARDGLASLLDAKALTSDQVRVGLAYRLLYEECGPGSGLGSQLEDRPRAVRASTHGAVARGLLVALAGVRLTAVDRAVDHADPSGRALVVLRAVAGEGRTVRSLGAGGNTNRANLEALKLSLKIALASLNSTGGLRIGER